MLDLDLDPPGDLDVLFVIDDSATMAEEQFALSRSFPRFMEVLAALPGGLPDVNIGVVSSNVGTGTWPISGCAGDGDDGALLSTPGNLAPEGCPTPDGAFIQDWDDGAGGRLRNYGGTIADNFRCIALRGINGCNFEMHLESMRRALDGSVAANADFHRQDALLALVILADEDDCSAHDRAMFDTGSTGVEDPFGPLTAFRCFEYGIDCAVGNEPRRAIGERMDCVSRPDSPYMDDVSEYISFLRDLKPDAADVVTVSISADPTPVDIIADDLGRPALAASCTSSLGIGRPGIRLAGFLDGFPGRAQWHTVCDPDVDAELGAAAELIAGVMSASPCLLGPIADRDPDASGIQHSCLVFDRIGVLETELPGCSDAGDPASSTNRPCHTIATDAVACARTPSQLAVAVHRTTAAEPGTHVMVRCRD